MRNFKRLKIWENGLQIVLQSYQLVKTFPEFERYALGTQISKAAVCIPSNIAEGSSRSGVKDHSRFIQIALGSSFELETQVIIANLLKYGNPELNQQILLNLDSEQKMLIGFLNKLKE